MHVIVPKGCTTPTTSTVTPSASRSCASASPSTRPSGWRRSPASPRTRSWSSPRAYATTRPAAIRTLIGMGHRARGGDDVPHDRLPAGARRRLARARRRHRRHDRLGGLVAARPRARSRGPSWRTPSTSARSTWCSSVARSTELDPPIRALVVYNANPAAIAPDQRLVLEGLRRDDLFTVVIEQFLDRHRRTTPTSCCRRRRSSSTSTCVPSWGQRLRDAQPAGDRAAGRGAPEQRDLPPARPRGWGSTRSSSPTRTRSSSARRSTSDDPLLEGVTWEHLLEHGYAKAAVGDDWRPYADGGFATPSGQGRAVLVHLAGAGARSAAGPRRRRASRPPAIPSSPRATRCSS